MSQDLIRYDLLAQDALRGVVRTVLADAAKSGLPGEHHFFVGFDTRAPGVRISNRLRERYPDEMTVVIQHQFWDLEVTETSFSVSLSFNGIPEKLVVPFAAVKGFVDPSVQFRLLFEPVVADGEEAIEGETAESIAAALAMDEAAVRDEAGETPPDDVRQDEPGTAEVVSLDAFRKKS